MYTVPNDPNVMQTADGDRCRTCWMIGVAAKNERRRQKSALRAAARARLKATKVALGRPPVVVAQGAQGEMTEAKARILRGLVKFLKENPGQPQDALPAYERQLREYDAVTTPATQPVKVTPTAPAKTEDDILKEYAEEMGAKKDAKKDASPHPALVRKVDFT